LINVFWMYLNILKATIKTLFSEKSSTSKSYLGHPCFILVNKIKEYLFIYWTFINNVNCFFLIIHKYRIIPIKRFFYKNFFFCLCYFFLQFFRNFLLLFHSTSLDRKSLTTTKKMKKKNEETIKSREVIFFGIKL